MPATASTSMGCTTPAEAALALLLFPPRFVIMFAAELLAFTACIIAGFGAELPLAPWRRALVQAVVPACSRVVLATVGIHRVRCVGQMDPTVQCFVPNHQCILDGFVLVACLQAPSFVARMEGLANFPVYGTICRGLQIVFVRRADAASRRACADAIVERVRDAGRERADRRWPPLVVFAEGTTARDGRLLEFKPGAFRAGEPVQPVLLRYDDGLPLEGPGGGLFAELVFLVRLLARTSTACELRFLPPRRPSAEERADPVRYAAAVRAAMQAELDERTLTHPLHRRWVSG